VVVEAGYLTGWLADFARLGR